jgi:hypothetical protein
VRLAVEHPSRLEAGHGVQTVQRRFGFVGVIAFARYDHRNLSDPHRYEGWFESEECPACRSPSRARQ